MPLNFSRNRMRMQEGGDTGDGDEVGINPPQEPNQRLEDLTGTVDDRLAGTLPEGGTYTAEKLADADQTGTDINYTPLGDSPKVTAEEAEVPDNVTAPIQPGDGTYSYEADTTTDKIREAEAANLSPDEISGKVDITAPQGTLSEDAIAIAAQTEVEEEQLLSFQLGELYSSMEAGKPLPPWASGPVKAAMGIMQARGLGSSSMAAAAVSQAVLQAGIPIAAADAAEYSKINIANLNNRQATVLQNAAAVAQMDLANLDARMKAAVTNAQSFLAIDLANLSNEQATETLNYQGMLQAVFTDSAAQNAAAQFNAESQQQVDEFFSELGVQVDNANANRVSAMAQFNTDQVNSVAQFNATIEDARSRFDSSMTVQIDQANAQWRRTIATADTAAVNEQNRTTAMSVLDVSQTALSALWQRYRDESAWLMQSSENAVSRSHQLAMLEFEKNANTDMYGLESQYETAASVGNAALALTLGYISNSN